jgi:hypothetical protein
LDLIFGTGNGSEYRLVSDFSRWKEPIFVSLGARIIDSTRSAGVLGVSCSNQMDGIDWVTGSVKENHGEHTVYPNEKIKKQTFRRKGVLVVQRKLRSSRDHCSLGGGASRHNLDVVLRMESQSR